MSVPAVADLEVLAEGPLTPAQLHIAWQPDRAPIAPVARQAIDARWAGYLAAADKLFNGPITCLGRFATAADGLHLTLYPSDYKTFLVTVVRDRPWFLQHAPAAMTPALGNSALLTYRHQALLGVRSPHVSAYAGRTHLFGGAMDQLATPQLPATAAGILAHLARELHEELRLTPADLAPAPTLLGLFRDAFLAQPELVWHWELTRPPEQLAHRLDPHEHTQLQVLTLDTAPPATLTPMAHGAWYRWRSALLAK